MLSDPVENDNGFFREAAGFSESVGCDQKKHQKRGGQMIVSKAGKIKVGLLYDETD